MGMLNGSKQPLQFSSRSGEHRNFLQLPGVENREGATVGPNFHIENVLSLGLFLASGLKDKESPYFSAFNWAYDFLCFALPSLSGNSSKFLKGDGFSGHLQGYSRGRI